MRKVILQMQTSIDGFVGDKNGNGSWMQWNWGPAWTWPQDLQQYHIDTVTSADEILLSDAIADEGLIDHWTAVAQDISNPQAQFASKIAKAHKTVFTRRTLDKQWVRTDITTEDIHSKVQTLKTLPGKNIIAFGGARFATSLLKEHLVDELHLIVNPVSLSDGLSIFKTGERMRFSLIDAKPYSNGVVVLRYRLA